MPIRKLEHYNVITDKLDETIKFYTDALGMRFGPAPAMAPGAGAWIYDETDTPVVHLVSVAPQHLAVMPEFIKERAVAAQRKAWAKTGLIDHLAFDCVGFDELVERLRQAGVPARENFVAAVNLRQLFVEDPNGVMLELNFR